MSKNTKTKKLSGIILILILTIMFVLMVMLFASLTVVSTAKNRTYVKYEQNQAYYTARSALDLYADSLLSDNTYETTKDISYTDSDGTTNVPVYNIKQGRALELDLYKIAVMTKDSLNRDVIVDDYWINAQSSDSIFQNQAEKDNYEIDSSTVPYIEYQVELPSTSNNNPEDYGKLVDGSGEDTKAIIKVEVLDRLYNSNPVYVAKDFEDGVATESEMKTAINNGKREKDYFHVKITSTVEFMGVEGVAVLEYSTREPQAIDSDNAMSSFGGIGAGTGNDLTVVGGASTGANMQAKDGRVYGELFAEKDYHETINAAAFPLYENEVFYIGGDYTWSQQCDKIKAKGIDSSNEQDRPLVYIGGTFGTDYDNFTNMDGTFPGSSSGGSTAMNYSQYEVVDIICHGFKPGNNDCNFNGNIICNGDMDVTSATNASFNAGTDGVVLVNGELKIKDNTKGLFYTTEEFAAPANWPTVTDDVNQTITVSFPSSGDLKVYAPSYTLANTPEDYTVLGPTTTLPTETDFKNASIVGQNITTASLTDLKKLDNPDEVTITLHDLCDVTGGQERKIPTHLSTFGQYYKPNPDFSEGDDPSTMYAKESERTSLNDAPKYFTFSSREEANGRVYQGTSTGNEPDYEPYDFKTQIKDTATTINLTLNGEHEITQEGNYILTPPTGQFKELIITGGGIVNIYMAPGTYNGELVKIADDTTVNFYLDSNYTDSQTPSSRETLVWGMRVINDQIYDYTLNNPKTDFIFYGNYNYDAPKIHYWIHENVDVSCTGSTGKTLFTGYIYAPDSKFDFSGSTERLSASGKYRLEDVNGKPYVSMGSIVARDIYTGGNANAAVAFLDPEAAAANPTDPMFNWQAKQYSRY